MGTTTEQTKRRRIIGWSIAIVVSLAIGGVISSDQLMAFLQLATEAL